jgi:hypothetical protein
MDVNCFNHSNQPSRKREITTWLKIIIKNKTWLHWIIGGQSSRPIDVQEKYQI